MPEEYGVFPVTPSDDMLVAGQEAWCVLHTNQEAIDDCKHAEAVWKAMTAVSQDMAVTVASRIKELAEEYGSVRDVANRLGVNATYLQRLADDSKASPSEELLTKLGLQRIPLYVRKT